MGVDVQPSNVLYLSGKIRRLTHYNAKKLQHWSSNRLCCILTFKNKWKSYSELNCTNPGSSVPAFYLGTDAAGQAKRGRSRGLNKLPEQGWEMTCWCQLAGNLGLRQVGGLTEGSWGGGGLHTKAEMCFGSVQRATRELVKNGSALITQGARQRVWQSSGWESTQWHESFIEMLSCHLAEGTTNVS